MEMPRTITTVNIKRIASVRSAKKKLINPAARSRRSIGSRKTANVSESLDRDVSLSTELGPNSVSNRAASSEVRPMFVISRC